MLTLTPEQRDAAALIERALDFAVKGSMYPNAALRCAIREIEAAAEYERDNPEGAFLLACVTYLNTQLTDRKE